MADKVPIIFIVGPPRSGTTMLGADCLGKLPEILYINEKHYIWSVWGDRKDSDELSISVAKKARAPIRKYIKRRLHRANKKMVIEKNPANCLRLPFIREVFPEAKFIFLRRNPSDCVRSALKEWSGEQSSALDSLQLRAKNKAFQVLLTGLEQLDIKNRFYSPRLIRGLLSEFPELTNQIARKFFNVRGFWGVRYKGITEDIRNDEKTLIDISVRQWYACSLGVQRFLEDSKNVEYLVVNYEDICGVEAKRSAINKELNQFLGYSDKDFLSGVVNNRQVCGTWDQEIHEKIKSISRLV